MKDKRELSDTEVKRLKKYINEHGGQGRVAVAWGISASTLSRTLNHHHNPSPLLRGKLEEFGIVKAA